jgi:hypothetical protein
MGWFYTVGGSRKQLIEELTESRENKRDDGLLIKTSCLAHAYRGDSFSGVLWTVFERRFFRDEIEVEKPLRWIGCDLIHCNKGDWGHKPMCEQMGPYYYSVPLRFLKMVPIEKYGGNAKWRETVLEQRAEERARRQAMKVSSSR